MNKLVHVETIYKGKSHSSKSNVTDFMNKVNEEIKYWNSYGYKVINTQEVTEEIKLIGLNKHVKKMYLLLEKVNEN